MGRKSMKRRGNWKDAVNTVEKIQELLADACPKIFMMSNLQWNPEEKDFKGLYSSHEMRAGWNMKLLKVWLSSILKPLVTNDPRGGFYSQEDMQKAISNLGEQDANTVHVALCVSETHLPQAQLHTFTDRGR